MKSVNYMNKKVAIQRRSLSFLGIQLWCGIFCSTAAINRVHIQTASGSVQPFCWAATHGRFGRIHQVVPMWPPCNTCLLGPTPSPQPKRHLNWFSRFCTRHNRALTSGPPSNTWFLGPTRVLNPNSISIRWAISAWFTSDRLSERPCCIYVCSTVKRHKIAGAKQTVKNSQASKRSGPNGA